MEDTDDNPPVFTKLSSAVIENENGALTEVKVPLVKTEHESSDNGFRNDYIEADMTT